MERVQLSVGALRCVKGPGPWLFLKDRNCVCVWFTPPTTRPVPITVHHHPAVWPQARYLTSLCFRFLFCKMEQALGLREGFDVTAKGPGTLSVLGVPCAPRASENMKAGT